MGYCVKKVDHTGIWISSLCALHCIALPLLLPVLPLLASSIFAQDWFERLILSASLVIGFAALFIGFYRHHRELYPLYSLTLGGVIYWHKDMFGHEYEPLTIGFGAALIIIAHWLNLKLCHHCHDCHDCQDEHCASDVANDINVCDHQHDHK